MVATVAGIHLGIDTHANRPAGNAVPDGSVYSCSTHGLVYKSNFAGNSWATWATLGGTLGAWTAYTPTWSSDGTPPTTGNATLSGRYKALDSKTYALQIRLVFGSTSAAGTGAWSFTLPAGLTSGSVVQVLAGFILDTGTRYYVANGRIGASATIVQPVVHSESGSAGQAGAAAPITWATGDEINLSGTIEVV